jgi:hypothetical protein
MSGDEFIRLNRDRLPHEVIAIIQKQAETIDVNNVEIQSLRDEIKRSEQLLEHEFAAVLKSVDAVKNWLHNAKGDAYMPGHDSYLFRKSEIDGLDLRIDACYHYYL